jgi:hypothetical protein
LEVWQDKHMLFPDVWFLEILEISGGLGPHSRLANKAIEL